MRAKTLTLIEYIVRITASAATHAASRRHSSQFSPAMRNRLLAAIRATARREIRAWIKARLLDRSFKVHVE